MANWGEIKSVNIRDWVIERLLRLKKVLGPKLSQEEQNIVAAVAST